MTKEQIKVQESLRKKRNDYLNDIIGQFKQSDITQNVFNCYEYVSPIFFMEVDNFKSNITKEEREMFEGNPKGFLIPLESFETFTVYLKNNSITF